MVAPLIGRSRRDERVLVGPDTGDDAGVFLHGGEGLIATADFITPVSDDPVRFGRVAAANSISDVFAMGGSPLFALNLCHFPEQIPQAMLTAVLEGAAGVVEEAGAVVLGGHTVQDRELKFGLAVVGRGDPQRLLTNAAAAEGDRLVLTKPLGTGVLINAFRKDKIDAAGLEPALVEMERTNGVASELALKYRIRAATDVTGFGLAGHALAVARASDVGLQLVVERVPVHEAFAELAEQGVSTRSTQANRSNVEDRLEDRIGMTDVQRELLYDPQTSGGLLLAVRPENLDALMQELLDTGHRAAEIGEAVAGPGRLIVV